MKKLVIIIQIITILFLMSLFYNQDKPGFAATEKEEFYYMTSTGYSRECIGKKWNDGFTATMTPIREGIAAINVDWIDGEWQVRSPLKLGQRIYIEGMGEFSVEDKGPFTEKNYRFDMWNLDIFYDDYNQAKEHGIKRIKVTVLKEE